MDLKRSLNNCRERSIPIEYSLHAGEILEKYVAMSTMKLV